MATTTEISTHFEPAGGPILFRGVGWDDYEKMLQIVGERHIRVAYDMGIMEVSMPSQRHERVSQ
jgi:hypothetical protein